MSSVLPIHILQPLLFEDRRLGGQPRIPQGARSALDAYLLDLAVDDGLLGEHLRFLQANAGLPFRHKDGWVEERLAAVMRDGSGVLTDEELAIVILDPVALGVLSEEVMASMPRPFLSAFERYGSERGAEDAHLPYSSEEGHRCAFSEEMHVDTPTAVDSEEPVFLASALDAGDTVADAMTLESSAGYAPVATFNLTRGDFTLVEGNKEALPAGPWSVYVAWHGLRRELEVTLPHHRLEIDARLDFAWLGANGRLKGAGTIVAGSGPLRLSREDDAAPVEGEVLRLTFAGPGIRASLDVTF